MADPTPYPFDPTGQAPTNRITGEQIIVLAPGDRLFHFSMPQFAPFFEEGSNLRLRDLNNNIIPLTNGVDYYFSHKFLSASLATMHPVYGSISWLRRDIVGTLIMDYNTLGGVWTVDSQTITEVLMNTSTNPRVTTWEQVVDRPIDFPVIDHPWNLDDMVGQKEILEVLNNFYEAYLASLDPNGGGGGSSIILDHINNKNNPHQTTFDQVGSMSVLQIQTLIANCLKLDGTAANSQQLGGQTLAQVMAAVVTTKVNNAAHADAADNATVAASANDALALGGQSLQNILQTVAGMTVANAQQFSGKDYATAKADILSGQAADSALLEGKSLAEIKSELQQSTGDASTLNGKNLTQIMQDVVATKVNNAASADLAQNSNALGGQTLAQVLAAVAATVPDNAHNAEKVYNYTFPELIENILQNDAYYEGLTYSTSSIDFGNATIQHPNNGGTVDGTFTYGLVGTFPIATTGANNEFYDPTIPRRSTSLDFYLFFLDQTVRARLNITYHLSNNKMTMDVYSDQGDLASICLFGLRSVPGTLKSSDGTKTSQVNEVYFAVKSSLQLVKYGVYQFVRNDFSLDSPDHPNLYDSTFVSLNDVVWQNASQSVFDAAIRADTQAAFDSLADLITNAITAPAA